LINHQKYVLFIIYRESETGSQKQWITDVEGNYYSIVTIENPHNGRWTSNAGTVFALYSNSTWRFETIQEWIDSWPADIGPYAVPIRCMRDSAPVNE